MSDDDLTLQNEELDALKSIFGDEFVVDEDRSDDGSRLCSFTFQHKTEISGIETVIEGKLEMRLPLNYPSQCPPSFELMCPRMNSRDKAKLLTHLEEIYLDHIDQQVLYFWIDALKAKLSEVCGHNNVYTDDNSAEDGEELEAVACVRQSPTNSYSKLSGNNNSNGSNTAVCIPEIVSGSQITDRKSTFQAHVAAPLTSKDQVDSVLRKLRENPKIDRATHNIFAYRLQTDGSHSIQDGCEDDGEHHAGQRLLHLLERMHVVNAVVVVTRWYGGIHLGTDRFRHINSVAKDLLEARGFGQKPTVPKSNKDSTDKESSVKQKHSSHKRGPKH